MDECEIPRASGWRMRGATSLHQTKLAPKFTGLLQKRSGKQIVLHTLGAMHASRPSFDRYDMYDVIK